MPSPNQQQHLMSPKKAPSSIFHKASKSFTDLHSMLADDTVEKFTPITRQPYIAKAKARYSFKAQNHNELSFKKGWYMYIVHKQDDGWFAVELGKNSNDRVELTQSCKYYVIHWPA
ncbi:hypothetical protein QCA50_017060 [Cerrena zonata]|uniref:SH3 domain-containing protein n=1 Tax=Cerrena zonata TaxID=2478898 RepID=A0AAW0FGK3_9APHY